MYLLDQQDYQKGITNIYKCPNKDKATLNMEELLNISICTGKSDEVRFMTRLLDNIKAGTEEEVDFAREVAKIVVQRQEE